MKREEIGWAKCWAHDCENTAMVLLKSPGKDSFSLVWYCQKDAKLFRKNNSAKVVTRLRHDGNGRLTTIVNRKPEAKE
jgi:hypothetical protein